MNFLDEQTTSIFQKTAVKVIKSSLWRAWKGRQLVLNSALGTLWANLGSSWALEAPVRTGLPRDGGCTSHWGPGSAGLWLLHLASTTPEAALLLWFLELGPNSSGTSPWSQGELGCPGRGTCGMSHAHPCTLTPGKKAGLPPPRSCLFTWIISTAPSCW